MIIMTALLFQTALAMAPLPIDGTRLMGESLRLWYPRTGTQLAVVPWALAVDGLKVPGSVSTIDLRFANRGLARSSGADTVIRRRLGFERGHTHESGVFLVTYPREGMSWTLSAREHGGPHSSVIEGSQSRLPESGATLSDLIIGARGQGVVFSVGDHEIVLAPKQLVTRTEWLDVYYQLRSDSALSNLMTTIDFVQLFGGVPVDSLPALSLAFSSSARKGITEVQRELKVAQLPASQYRVDVVVRSAEGGEVAHRSVTMRLLGGPPGDTITIHLPGDTIR
jgi:hypothetical protein